MNQHVHNVWLYSRKTAIHVEHEFWELFRLATMERGVTISKLLAEIDRTHRLLPYQGPGRQGIGTECCGPDLCAAGSHGEACSG